MSQEPNSSPSRDQRVDEIIAAYLEAVDAGGTPDRQELLARHPDLAPDLEVFFADHDRVDQLAQPLRSPAPPPPPGTAPDDGATGVYGAAQPETLASGETPLVGPPLGTKVRYIGDYELLEELGRGGMGVVYKARQNKLRRLVALKMILAGEYAGENELARFRSEGQAVARLQHPNIVQIFEVGEHDGHPYFSLEFVDGGSLAQKLDGTPLPPKEAAKLVETLARAMHAAHQAGIVHRDLKPANVLLAADGTPKITDFGLAKKLGDAAGTTGSNAIMGTPSYMAPEQAGGKSKEAGPAADTYALGAILYECLTGRPPFKAATPLDTLLQVVSDEPAPPRQLQSKTPRDLETICLKCLQKAPGKRYASAAALAEDLRRFQAGEPIAARPVGRLERGVKWARRRPAVAGLLAALVVAALGLVGGGAWFTISLQNALGAAKTSAEAERGAKEKADAARTKDEGLAYAGQIALAQREWQDGDVGHARDLLAACQGNLRGWEYDYLDTLLNKTQRTFKGHIYRILSVAFSPDGKHLVSGSEDNTVKVWDAQTGQETLTVKRSTGPVVSVVDSPNGKRLVIGSQSGPVFSVAFSPDGKRLVSGSGGNGKNLQVWDAQTGQETLAIQGQASGVSSVAFSPDGKRLVSGSDDRTLKVWDSETGQETLTLQGQDSGINSVAFSPDGKRLVSGSRDNTVKVWDAQTGQETLTLKDTGAVYGVAFSPDGKRLVSGGDDAIVKVWDAQIRQEALTLKGLTSGVLSVAFSPDGKRIVSGHPDWSLKVWDAQTGQETLTLKDAGAVYGVAFSPDGKRLVSASDNHTVKVWDAETGQETLALQGLTSPVLSVAFSPDGKRLVSGSQFGPVKVWDAETGHETLTLKGPPNGVLSVAFSPDGKRIVSGSQDGAVRVWDAETGQETLTLNLNRDRVTVSPHGSQAEGVGWSVAFSPDGKRLVSGSDDGTLKMWDAETGQETLTLKGHNSGVRSVAFSPDGKRLVSGGGGNIGLGDNTVRMWNAQTGQETLTLKGHTRRVTSVAFSPDGKRLASGSEDGTIKVWDADRAAAFR